MKIAPRIRQLAAPQTTRNGNPILNRAGEPVYTQYLQITPEKKAEIQEHMRTWIGKIATAMNEMGIDDFATGAGIDTEMQTQINDEPRPYSWIERFEMVYTRLHQDRHKDLTTGIIDMYNTVTGTVYLFSGYPGDMLAHIRIDREDPLHRQVKTYLDPDLFG